MRTCHCDGIKIPRLRIPFPLWGVFQMGARFHDSPTPILWLFTSSFSAVFKAQMQCVCKNEVAKVLRHTQSQRQSSAL